MKLLNANRQFITRKIVEQTFKDRLQEIDDANDALAKKILAAAFGPDYKQQFARVPYAWLQTGNTIYYTIKGTDRRRYVVLKEATALPALVSYCGPPGIEFNKTIGKIFDDEKDAINDRRARITSDEEQLRTNLRGLLYGIPTVERLSQVYPEGYAVLGMASKLNTPLPPAVTCDVVRGLVANFSRVSV